MMRTVRLYLIINSCFIDKMSNCDQFVARALQTNPQIGKSPFAAAADRARAVCNSTINVRYSQQPKKASTSDLLSEERESTFSNGSGEQKTTVTHFPPFTGLGLGLLA
jgi:hypothetical protein